MRRFTIHTCVALAVLSLASLPLMKRLRAQVDPGEKVVESRKAGDRDQAGRALAAKSVASFSLPSVDVTIDHLRVAVHGQAKIVDPTSSINCMWSLIVRELESGQAVNVSHFDNQIFQGGPAGTAPLFKQELTLKPGKYAVELAIHSVSPLTDLNELTLTGARHPSTLSFRRKEIVVQ